jgi:hypothetical protein
MCIRSLPTSLGSAWLMEHYSFHREPTQQWQSLPHWLLYVRMRDAGLRQHGIGTTIALSQLAGVQVQQF